jgi:hypothetical protein
MIANSTRDMLLSGVGIQRFVCNRAHRPRRVEWSNCEFAPRCGGVHMGIVKVVGSLIAAALLFLLLAVKFGAAETRLACPGEVSRILNGQSPVTTPATLYARVDTYRWIVFWSPHDAMIFWEIQPGGHTGFGYYSDSSFARLITNFEGTKEYGSWSSLSQRIHVETSASGELTFDGTCKLNT